MTLQTSRIVFFLLLKQSCILRNWFCLKSPIYLLLNLKVATFGSLTFSHQELSELIIKSKICLDSFFSKFSFFINIIVCIPESIVIQFRFSILSRILTSWSFTFWLTSLTFESISIVHTAFINKLNSLIGVIPQSASMLIPVSIILWMWSRFLSKSKGSPKLNIYETLNFHLENKFFLKFIFTDK